MIYIQPKYPPKVEISLSLHKKLTLEARKKKISVKKLLDIKLKGK